MNERVKHIALVANTSWSIYNFRLGVVRALLTKGYKVYAIAPRDDYSDKLTAAGATYIPISLHAHSVNLVKDLGLCLQLFRIYRHYRFDFIFHYTIKANIYGCIVARMAGLRSVAIVTGLGRTLQFRQPVQTIVDQLYKLAAWSAEAVWFLNQPDRRSFIARGIVVPHKTKVLPSEGVNTSRFVGVRLDQKKHNVVRLLFAGRLLKDKGILEFVEAAKYFHQFKSRIKFEIAGFVHPSNPMSVSLAQLEEWQRNGWINYLGSHEDIRPFINRADCVVFPSYYSEGISRILLEAASMSRPIITTDQVGCREVVHHQKNGWLIPLKSVEHLISAIREFCALSMSEKVLMGDVGRKLARKYFDEQLIINEYLQFLSKNWSDKQTIHLPKKAEEQTLM